MLSVGMVLATPEVTAACIPHFADGLLLVALVFNITYSLYVYSRVATTDHRIRFELQLQIMDTLEKYTRYH